MTRLVEPARGSNGSSGRVTVNWLAVDRRPSVDRLDALAEAGFDVALVESVAEVRGAAGEPPSVVVVDVGAADVLGALADLAAAVPDADVVLLSMAAPGSETLMALQAGASGFCDPDAPPEALIRTLRDVARTGAAIPRDLARHLVDQIRHGRGFAVSTALGDVELTDREWEVLGLLRSGRSTREIATELFVSQATVRSHVAALLHKFDVDDRDALLTVLDAH